MIPLYITKVPGSNKTKGSNQSYFDNSIGFWGEITGVDSAKNRVRVKAVTGIEYIGLPVASTEWVKKYDKYVAGEVHLPPVGARVFVLTPTHTIAGAFVLCSGFAAGEASTHELFSDETKKEENNSISKRKTQGGWLEQENYKTGEKIISNGKITVTLDPTQDKEKGIIQVDESCILIDKDGITIQNAGAISITNSSAVTINADKDLTISTDSNNLTIKAASFTVKDNNNSELMVVRKGGAL